jgi:hypothetical protein
MTTLGFRRLLLGLASIVAIWALTIAVTGGFSIRISGIRVSSQNPFSAAMIALTLAAVAYMLTADVKDRPPRRSFRWSEPASMVGALGVLLVIYQWAQARPLWLDEEMLALNLRDRTFLTLAGPLWLNQSAPLGWLLLERAVLQALGSSELALRLIPSLFGVVTVLAAIWIGYRWMTPVGAAAFVLLCSFAQWLSVYSVELKPYSSDTFWALLLCAVAAWAAEADSDKSWNARVVVWGIAAAIGHWFSIGALLVTPACATVLLVALFRRVSFNVQGIRPMALMGVIWVLSFGTHYALSIRPTLASQYLQEFWSAGFPPASTGIVGRTAWLAGQLRPFAIKPGGTGRWVLFWSCAAVGFALARQRTLASVSALTMVSAFLLAALHIVPLFERLSLWVLVAVYVGIALFVDSTTVLACRSIVKRHWSVLALAIGMGAASLGLCADILQRGIDDVRLARPADRNRSMNDRDSVAWLMSQRESGDAVLTTQFGLPAIWWYGGVPISDTDMDGRRFRDGSPLFAVRYSSSEGDCGRSNLYEALKNRQRVLVYFGFEDFPKGFDELLLHQLRQLEGNTSVRSFGSLNKVAIIDRRPERRSSYGQPAPEIAVDRSNDHLTGCVTIRQAAKW